MRCRIFILALFVMCRFAFAQSPTTETTYGTIVEQSDQFVLVRDTNSAPQRHWFKWIDSPNSSPDAAMLATASALKPGETVKLTWSTDNDRRRIESIAASPLPAPAPAVAPASAPASQPTIAVSSDSATAGQTVNALMDDALAAAERLLAFPLLVLLPVLAIFTAGLTWTFNRFFARNRSISYNRAFLVLFALAAILLIDQKISLLENQLTALRSRLTADTTSAIGELARQSAHRQNLFFDAAAARSALAPVFGDVTIRPIIYDDATDLVQVHSQNPLTQAYLAIVDLSRPGVQIKIGADLNTKTLTSVFAQQNECTVAINGEAGLSPEPGSGLGTWRGLMIQSSRQLLQEDARVPRPFLSFDSKNQALFRSAASTDRSAPAQAVNALWGRLDALIDGVVQTGDERFRQPRTAMAIDQSGTRLFLLVVDGRQPRYSVGFTRAEVGQLLHAFGAFNGMLCDEGGSSCIYLKQFGGITNIPSDNQGQERPTYTHFGIAFHGSP